MTNHIKITVKEMALALALLLLVLPLVSSVGVANSYWDENPLKLAPGESTIISLRLQNDETTGITMNVSVNSSIASLVNGSQYVVPTGKVSIPVYIKISIPDNTAVGTTYNIPVSFTQISAGQGGMVQVAQGITSKIPITVVGVQDSSLYGQSSGISTTTIMIILAIIIVGVVVYSVKTQRAKRR